MSNGNSRNGNNFRRPSICLFDKSVASLGAWGGGKQASAPTPLLRTYRCQNTPPSLRRDGWGRGSGALDEKGETPMYILQSRSSPTVQARQPATSIALYTVQNGHGLHRRQLGQSAMHSRQARSSLPSIQPSKDSHAQLDAGGCQGCQLSVREREKEREGGREGGSVGIG